jgi:hypothetical protein
LALYLPHAYFWLQIQKIWPPFTEAATSVGTNPLAWFIVLMFILAVVAFHRPKMIRDAGERRGDEPSENQMGPSTNSQATVPKSQKIFIDVAAAYLMGLYKNRTSIQGDALAAAYIGKWVVVTGKVRDIYVSGDSLTAQIYDADDSFISAGFSKEASENSHIAHGTTITIRGEIAAFDTMRLKLQKCDLDPIGGG